MSRSSRSLRTAPAKLCKPALAKQYLLGLRIDSFIDRAGINIVIGSDDHCEHIFSNFYQRRVIDHIEDFREIRAGRKNYLRFAEGGSLYHVTSSVRIIGATPTVIISLTADQAPASIICLGLYRSLGTKIYDVDYKNLNLA